jgi:hypothetical protein
MEPQKSEKSVEPRREGQAAPSRQPEGKRRFQIVKLEERIAPRGPGFRVDSKPCKTCLSGGASIE